MAKGYFNGAGLTTCEVYLIKAECLARQVTGNDFSAAMDVLNKVRKTRILPEIYQPLQASTLTEAIDLIRRSKDNELIFTIVPFADARRFNAEGTLHVHYPNMGRADLYINPGFTSLDYAFPGRCRSESG